MLSGVGAMGLHVSVLKFPEAQSVSNVSPTLRDSQEAPGGRGRHDVSPAYEALYRPCLVYEPFPFKHR
eukprot:3338423-Pyramimonas_sp.AAC.1